MIIKNINSIVIIETWAIKYVYDYADNLIKERII